MSLRPRSRLSWALVVSAALAVSLLPATAASAGPSTKTSSFTAAISPTKVTVGIPTTFTVTVVNAPTSSNGIGSVQVVVPADMTLDTIATPSGITSPSGWVYSFPSCSADSPTGCSAAGARLVQVSTPSNRGADKVGAGRSLTFTITATPGVKGQSTWATAAKNSAAWSTGQLLTETGGDPVVTVYGAPAQLAFGILPSSVVAGVTFRATVAVEDVDGAPTISTSAVTLSGASLQGSSTPVSAVDGTATFSGLSLTTAGTIQLTATSGSLTPTTASVQVNPADPDHVSVSAAGSVVAGKPLAVKISVFDPYQNQVSNSVTAFITDASGAQQTSQTFTGGAATLTLLNTPTVVGTYVYTVRLTDWPNVAPQSFSVTVVADSPTHLTIDQVSSDDPNASADGCPTSGAALQSNCPFDVVVTARDDHGNPSPYTGSVTLSTSGGTGSGLGALTGSTSASFTDTSTMTFTGLTYTGYGNTISLAAAADANDLTSDTRSIDVNLFVTVLNAAPKQNITVTNSGCTDATPQVPICSSLILPNGANGTVTLAQGACQPYTSCLIGAQNQALLVEGLADLTGLYTRAKPAAIELRCDKTLCGGAGATSFNIVYQPSATATNLTPSFAVAPPCPSKGRIGPNQTFCQDLTQDHRDNAGDLVAYLLFLDDAKASFG